MLGQFFASFNTFDVVAWTIGVGVLLFALVPILLCPGRCSSYVTHDPEGAREVAGDTPTSRRYRELEALGFSPVGRLCEVNWFPSHEWRKVFWYSIWANADRTIWAAVYQLQPGIVPRVRFDSFTKSRSRVYTAIPGVGFELELATVRRIEHNGPLPNVLDHHRTQSLVFAETRNEHIVPVSFENFHDIRAELDVIDPPEPIWIYFRLFWLTPFLICSCAMLLLGSLGWTRSISVAGLVAAVTYLVFALFTFPLLFRYTEQALLRPNTEEEPNGN